MGQTQQFTAVATGQGGTPLSPQPAFAWTATGGGTITSAGLFTAGAASGGPFTVTATSGGAAGNAQVSVTSLTALLQINAGGGAVAPFTPDKDYAGGTAYSTAAPVTTTGVANAAPAAAYQTERYGNFTYTLAGLTPGAAYTLRLHFAEIYWTAAGQRLFNVKVNGAQVLTNFDVFAAAGGKNRR